MTRLRTFTSTLLALALTCAGAIPPSAYAANGFSQTAANNTTETITSVDQRWDKLFIGVWYVPVTNLLAYLVDPVTVKATSLSDETFFQITSCQSGVFSGTATVRFSTYALGWPAGTPFTYTMSGNVTPGGKIRITFTPTTQGHPVVTGVGNMYFVDGAWRMTMQMASGSSDYVTHWAYMSKSTMGDHTSIPPVGALSQKFSWFKGTRWNITDSQLANGQPGAGVWFVEGYRNGYFWGRGTGSSSFFVGGSITPEGDVFLAITPSNGVNYMRCGRIQHGRSDVQMAFRSYEGSSAEAGAARLRH